MKLVPSSEPLMKGESDLCPLLKRSLLKLNFQEVSSSRLLNACAPMVPGLHHSLYLKKEDDDVSPAWVPDNQYRALNNWVFTCSDSGYINGDLMLRWLHESFLPHIAYE